MGTPSSEIGDAQRVLRTFPGAAVPFAALFGPALRGEPNLAEIIRGSVGVTYWFTDAKARTKLGYAPRDLEAGLKTMLATQGTEVQS